jgi:hypothetical protein
LIVSESVDFRFVLRRVEGKEDILWREAVVDKYLRKSTTLETDLLFARHEFAKSHGPIHEFNAYEESINIIERNLYEVYENKRERTIAEANQIFELYKNWETVSEPVALLARTMDIYGDTEKVKLVEFFGRYVDFGFKESYANWHQIINEDDDGQPEVALGFDEPYLFLELNEESPFKKSSLDYQIDNIVEIPLSRIEIICYLNNGFQEEAI